MVAAISTAAVAQESRVPGRIINADTKRPAAGSVVTVTDRQDKVIATTTTDAQGNFIVESQFTGLVTVKVSLQGFQSAQEQQAIYSGG